MCAKAQSGETFGRLVRTWAPVPRAAAGEGCGSAQRPGHRRAAASGAVLETHVLASPHRPSLSWNNSSLKCSHYSYSASVECGERVFMFRWEGLKEALIKALSWLGKKITNVFGGTFLKSLDLD